jgi:hypothetical protein
LQAHGRHVKNAALQTHVGLGNGYAIAAYCVGVTLSFSRCCVCTRTRRISKGQPLPKCKPRMSSLILWSATATF